jgi:hypothetical protein
MFDYSIGEDKKWYILYSGVYLFEDSTTKEWESSMDKFGGTVFLYDAENMKVPVSQAKKYKVPRINLEIMTDALKKRFPDTHRHFVSFGKRYFDKNDKRNENINKFNVRLERLGYSIVEKIVRVKSGVFVNSEGEAIEYKYDDCDTDGDIIHFIHTVGKGYNRIVMISGDGDMEQPLKYVMDNYSSEVWIIAHRETMSNIYRNYNYIFIDELLKDGQ